MTSVSCFIDVWKFRVDFLNLVSVSTKENWFRVFIERLGFGVELDNIQMYYSRKEQISFLISNKTKFVLVIFNIKQF